MTIFDLVFLAVFFASGAAVAFVLAALVRGRTAVARRRATLLALGLGAYVAVGLITTAVLPRRQVRLGENECSDDWCIAATADRRAPAGDGTVVDVTFRVSSRAKRVRQRERDVVTWIEDATGRRWGALSDSAAAATPFDVELGPGDAVEATRRYRVPADATGLALVIGRGGVPFPVCCIIGEGFFRRRPYIPLAP